MKLLLSLTQSGNYSGSCFGKVFDIIKRFMLKQTSKNDLGLFVSLSGMETPIKEEDIPKLPLTIVIPAL